MTITGIPALTLADLKTAWPGWDISIRRHHVWGIHRTGVRDSLWATSLPEMNQLITTFEQAAA